MTLAPGIHRGIPFADYLDLPYLSSTELKRLQRSPWAYDAARREPVKPTSAMSLGTATHAAVLEPLRFTRDFVVFEGDKRTKEWKAFQAEHAGDTIISAADFEAATAMQRAVFGHAPAMRHLKQGDPEVTLVWDDPSGRRCKARIDWLHTAFGPVLVDLKTTMSADARRFGSQAFSLGYHIQAAHYCEGWYALTHTNPEFIFIAVENKQPFEPAVFNAGDDVLELGRDERSRLILLLDECEKTNHWPPACSEETRLVLPRYAYGSEDSDIADLGLHFAEGA